MESARRGSTGSLRPQPHGLYCPSLGIPKLFSYLDRTFDPARICIKIPSTWEGLQACRVLQATGITTLATTLFTIEQAVLAGEVNCHYIAPYVNELKCHVDPNYQDPNPQLELSVAAQRYYLHDMQNTRVIPASLITPKQVMLLAGANYMTIAPILLEELAETSYASDVTRDPSLFVGPANKYSQPPDHMHFENDEAKFRVAVTRSGGGANERKMVQAINIFCDMQLKLEEMMKSVMKRTRRRVGWFESGKEDRGHPFVF